MYRQTSWKLKKKKKVIQLSQAIQVAVRPQGLTESS